MNYKNAIIAVCALLLNTNIITAQKPEEIESVIVSGKDSTWYALQYEAWNKEVEKDDKSEKAWRNLSEAKWYLKYWFNEKEEQTDSSQLVIKRMEKAIPETFTYNLCRLRTEFSSKSHWGEKALALLPDNPNCKDAEILISYMWLSGYAETENNRTELFNKLLLNQYRKGYYPDFALRFSYNQLEALPNNAIYIGLGDLDLFPKIMMQRAMGIHTDKSIIVSSFMSIKGYATSVCKGLGISVYNGLKDTYINQEDISNTVAGFIRHIAKQTGRPVYFAAGVGGQIKALSSEIYGEGIIYKYSNKPYDNIAATKKALENKYHLEYLSEPKFHNENYWKGSEMLQVNYVVGLAHIVKHYINEGNLKRANWLYDTLKASIENTRLPQDVKQQYVNYLNSKKQ